VDGEWESGFEDVAGDGFAHQPQAYVTDFQHVFLLGFSWDYTRLGRETGFS
jgi:hypothetical protein